MKPSLKIGRVSGAAYAIFSDLGSEKQRGSIKKKITQKKFNLDKSSRGKLTNKTKNGYLKKFLLLSNNI